MLPEPYWDFNMVSDKLTYAQMKRMLNRACQTKLTKQEEELFRRSLKHDKEMVLHIDMCPAKLPDLILHNSVLATEILIYFTNAQEV